MEASELAELVVECARYGELDELKELDARLLATARDQSGNSAMHMACANGHLDVLSYLLEHVALADFTPLNNAGSNPLHWACLKCVTAHSFGCAPCDEDSAPSSRCALGVGYCCILLSGAQKDRGGMTPIEVAEAKGSEAAMECAGLLLGILTLREKGAKPSAKNSDTTSLEEDLERANLEDDDRPKAVAADPER